MPTEAAAASLSATPRDDRKSARLAARNLTVTQDARTVTGFALAREILRSPHVRQSADIGAERFDLSNPDTAPVIFLDGEAHRRKRTAIARFFTPTAVATQYRAVMEAVTGRLIGQLQAQGRTRLDVISFELAVAVASEIVGLTSSNHAAMARRLASTFDTGTTPRTSAVAKALGNLVMGAKSLNFFYRDVRPAIRARRARPREDVISQLIERGASDQAILMECLVYASAGMVTTREFIVMVAWHLFERDDLRARFLAGDEEAQFAILDEILRLEPVAAMVHRTTQADVPAGSALEAGAHYAIDIRAANTDEAVVGACPFALDPDRAAGGRSAATHLSFGDGAHRCPGASVALHETRVFIDRLLRVPGLRLERAPDMYWNAALASYELRNAVVACEAAGRPA